LAREERMAVGANFEFDGRTRGTRLDDVAASAANRRGNVFGVDAFFHSDSP